MRPPYSVLARRMGPGGAGALRGARVVIIHPSVSNPSRVACVWRGSGTFFFNCIVTW